MKISKLSAFCFISIALSAVGCEKDPGEGGTSSITGYAHVTDYNATFQIIQDEYPGRDEDIYIIYGDDVSYGDRIKTGPDGRFEFKYLREGKYTLYMYSGDTSLAGVTVVYVPAEIKEKKQTVDVGTIEIKKN